MFQHIVDSRGTGVNRVAAEHVTQKRLRRCDLAVHLETVLELLQNALEKMLQQQDMTLP